jgi:hypothetical protein
MKAAVLVVLVVAVSAQVRLTATVAGQQVSIPVLGIIAVVVVLALAAVVLVLARQLLRDGLRLRPRPVNT